MAANVDDWARGIDGILERFDATDLEIGSPSSFAELLELRERTVQSARLLTTRGRTA